LSLRVPRFSRPPARSSAKESSSEHLCMFDLECKPFHALYCIGCMCSMVEVSVAGYSCRKERHAVVSS
jgi:hypothetical protein